MRNKGSRRTADHSQAKARPPCSKCGKEAHANKDTCPATGRRCLKCGRPNHVPACARVQPTTEKTSEPTQWSVSSRPTHTVGLKKRSF